MLNCSINHLAFCSVVIPQVKIVTGDQSSVLKEEKWVVVVGGQEVVGGGGGNELSRCYPNFFHRWGNPAILWNLVPSGIGDMHQQLHVADTNCGS